MMKFVSKVSKILFFCAFLNSCSDLVNEELSVDNSLPGSSPDSSTEIVDPEESKPRLKVSIRPIGMEMDGVSSLVVASNEGNTKTRSVDVEQTNAPYALYSLDEEGNIKLTLFYFEVVVHIIEDETESPDGESPDGDSPSEEDNITKADSEPGTEPDTDSDTEPGTEPGTEPDTDSDPASDSDPDSEADTQEEIIAQYVETIKKELTDAIQVVPAIMADFGRYIFFSGCQYYINDLVVSDEVRAICEEFIRDEKAQGKGSVFMIRKSDGALFDVSSLDILRYKRGWNVISYPDCIEQIRNPHYNDEYNLLAEDSYAITSEGDLLVLGTSCIYKVEDNGDAIDFKPVTKSALDAFILTPDGYIYLYDPLPSILTYLNLPIELSYWDLRNRLYGNQKFEYECYAPDGKFSMLDLSMFEDEPFYYLGQWVDQRTSTIYLSGLCLEDRITIRHIPISGGQSQTKRDHGSSVQMIHSFEESPFIVMDEHTFYLKGSEKVISCTFNKNKSGMWWHLTEVDNADQSLLNPANYDYTFEEGENFYGYKLVDGQISITKVSSIGILIEQEFVDVEIPHNSISVETEFYEQIGMICVKLSGRTDDGGFWSRDYNLTTREESQIQIENLSVVTIVKIN